jgi:hypothetical protein
MNSEEENRYLYLLSQNKTFREMAVELGWSVEEVEAFGDAFFGRAFEEKRRSAQ